MSILVIGEKPSVSKELAKVLGADKKGNGFIEGNGYIVSWCFGHLVGLKYPNDYSEKWADKWSFDQLPMIPTEWKFSISKNTKAQYDILKDLMSRTDVSEIICATDADREGEAIFRYVYNMTKCRKPVKRLWVSSLEESAIKSALAKMKPGEEYNNLFQAAFCRAKADWLVGMNGSRLFSVRYNSQLNTGRVQTPTLAMIEDFDENAEKKGLGTPATRAGTIENLVNHGYIIRDGKKIVSTDKGKKLIAVIPEEIKSPMLTAEWENQLLQVERGALPADVFMSGIEKYVADLCSKYSNVDEKMTFGSKAEPIGKCPKCSSDVTKGKFGFYCTGKCGMNVSKVYGKELSESQITNLLNGKSVSYTANNKKTVVLPEFVQNDYNGKTYYQWKTERK